MSGINTPEYDLSLDYFRGLENNKENRKEFLKYSDDELKNIQNQAIESGEFEVAAFIRDVLKDKAEKSKTEIVTGNEDIRNQLVGAMATGQSDTTATEGSVTEGSVTEGSVTEGSVTEGSVTEESVTEEIKEEPAKAINEATTEESDDELVKTDGEFINLWRRQQDVAKKIEDYYKERGIKNEFGHIISIHPRTIHFDGDSIFVYDMWNNHLFKQVNGEIKEIPLLKDKMYDNCKIRGIDKIGDYYAVNLCFLDADGWVTKNHKGEENSLYFIIDKDGNYLPGLRDQTGDEKFSLGRFGEYEFEQDLGNNEVFCTIFNKNMEKIASYKDEKEGKNKKNIVYCDDKACILEESWSKPGLYTIFVGNQIVGEGTKKDLEGNEYMQNFLKMKEKENLQIKKLNEKRNRMRSTPFEERYMDKNHCRIVYKDDEKTAIAIENDKGETLFELSNIKEISYINETTPYFRTNMGDVITIEHWKTDNNVLFIRVASSDGTVQKSIFINKTNRESKEFDGQEYSKLCLYGNVIEAFTNENDSELYDDDFNYLGIVDDGNKNFFHYNELGFFTIMKEEDGDKKYYIISKKTGKIVTRYLKQEGKRAYLNYYREGDKTYLIVNVPEKGVCQVEV